MWISLAKNFLMAPMAYIQQLVGFVQNEVLICGGDYNSDPDSNCWILGQSKTIKMEHGRAYSYGIVLNDEVSNLLKGGS